MHKTTLYIPEVYIQALRALTPAAPRMGLTHHIRRAIRLYLEQRQTKTPRLATWRRCKSSSARPRFGEGVAYQRALREEWDQR